VLTGEKAPECGAVARVIQTIGDIVISVLAGQFVNLQDSFLGCLEGSLTRRSTLDGEIC
jgi:hypothetical protein